MTDGGTPETTTIYRATTRGGTSQLHLAEDCEHLKKANTVVEKDLGPIPPWMREWCDSCASHRQDDPTVETDGGHEFVGTAVETFDTADDGWHWCVEFDGRRHTMQCRQQVAAKGHVMTVMRDPTDLLDLNDDQHRVCADCRDALRARLDDDRGRALTDGGQPTGPNVRLAEAAKQLRLARQELPTGVHDAGVAKAEHLTRGVLGAIEAENQAASTDGGQPLHQRVDELEDRLDGLTESMHHDRRRDP